jgi:quercetin dioxygenase-like cupin family protein
MSVTTEPKEAKAAPLLSKDLTGIAGKEGLMIMVEYPPGSSDPIHRHNAYAFIYALESSIRNAGESSISSNSLASRRCF